MKRPSGNKEPESAKQLRQRQIVDMAELDEDENERIKNLFIRRSGSRAFRSSVRNAGTAANAAAGGGSSRSSGSIGGSGGFRRGPTQKV